MHQALQQAFVNLFQTIPREILQDTFKAPYGGSIDQVIMSSVITSRVLPDCNLVGGKMKNITLLHEYHEQTLYGVQEDFANRGLFSIYRIPANEREGLPIVAVNGVAYPEDMSSNPYKHYNDQGANMATLTQSVLHSHTYANVPITPTPELLEGDLVRLLPSQTVHIDWVLSVRLGYDNSFSTLNANAVFPFIQLVEHAVKNYIYNQMIIGMGQAKIMGGHELGIYRDVIQTYSDSNDKYLELLKDFKGGAVQDTQRLLTLFKHMC